MTTEGYPGIVTPTTFGGTVFKDACAKKGRVDKLLERTATTDATADALIEALVAHTGLAAQSPVETELGAGRSARRRDRKDCDPRKNARARRTLGTRPSWASST